jgi:hypothetical protein
VIHLNLEPALMACHAPTLQRAIFVLLDEVIAVASRNSSISISLHPCENEFLLEIRPGPPPGLRQKLCCHLMQLAGGRVIAASAGILATMFQKSCPAPAVTNADAILLPPPSLVSSNTGVQR